MAKNDERLAERIDPAYPNAAEGHPVTELTSDRQGALSPFGTITFPLEPESVSYVHPTTEINWESN
jgi:hypothetical protein